MTKKIYQPDNDTPYDLPADVWHEPPYASKPGIRKATGG